MKKVNVLISIMDWFEELNSKIEEGSPKGLYITNNLEQVKGMVRDGEVGRIGIIMQSLTTKGHDCAEKIHAVDPNIEIFVWEGRSTLDRGGVSSIRNDKEYYIENNSGKDAFEAVVNAATFFFNGGACKDIPDAQWKGMSISDTYK